MGTDEQSRQRQHDADDEDAAHHIAEQAHDQRECTRELLHHIERYHHPGRFGEGRQIARQSARAQPVDDGGDENDGGDGRVGLDMGRRRLDSGDQRRPVGDEHEQEDRADQRAEGRGIVAHGVADLGVDRRHDKFQRRLQARGRGFNRRVASAETPPSTAITPQATTTGSVIATGPR